MKIHEKYMRRCLQLAANGLGTTYPNPMVGSVIVHQGKIIGEGWHQRAGEPHAEVMAINSVRQPELLSSSSIYVNLEPCNHYGRTPPCSELIVKSGIPTVVIGSLDPNPKVDGTGRTRLEEAGLEVVTGVLEKECTELNKRFITFHQEKRPHIILKWAESPEGFIAPLEQQSDEPFWISSPYSKQQVHRLRSQEQAIMIGAGTLRKDNPSLTTRDWYGNSPEVIVLSRSGDLPKERKLWKTEANKLIIGAKTHRDPKGENIQLTVNKEGVKEILDHLYRYGIQSVIVEGGAETLNQFINSGYWDEALVFRGEQNIVQGLKAPVIEGHHQTDYTVKRDVLTHYKASL
ncbi:bifunctional diaminohydroxyphosphoribosylaminopyrimidine deaminase/5-amino-6-(5-phosphoribosylamino)uracil reductase RibD [Aureitalea marina]|uniref:Riboflavin biosynthesis protein RibD n=1 Tax=Aureitalea marina TaxID=930804 RepID=A0A2S7KN09_9FLAO|nr:bifunctional diaminohydroxyphosphoribosylaminopyrimidine deaminase/5-amino-6-(5-phosphoribosylamino)uracil reductase RibD [Aureitalea marina]PQB04017.1 riboflavin biosynthesis protein RibD [Aureitalea marina]